ncbi:hypothetical protein FLX56_27185 [Synechococcus moorigangaii CMS01]|nr:hypothetical protein [Synechococcus moorigangaii CMS01]
MVVYKFNLQIQGSNEAHSYARDLQSIEEDNPEQVFTKEVRESMRNDLQKQSLCGIKDYHLDQMIETWIADIKEGYRNSSIVLNLPLLVDSNLDQINEPGYQDLPQLVQPDLTGIEPCFGALPPLKNIAKT